MNRIDFVQSIEGYEDFQKSIVRFFDENMALYDLVGEYQNIDNIKGNIEDQSINFDIKFKNTKDSKKMYLVIYGKTINIYGHYYLIDLLLNKDIINIKLIEKNTVSV
jgi:hypothetical protein